MTLEEAKSLVSSRFLGVAGIHGVGIKRSRGAVRLYVADERDPGLAKALRDIRERVGPHDVIVTPASPPRLMTT